MDSHTAFNNLDYIIFGILLLSGLLALMRGFVREVLSLASWVGAYYVAARYYPLLEPHVRTHFNKSHPAVTMASAAILFVCSLIVFSLLGYMIARIIRGRALTAIDRSLGFIFGIARGGLVVCIVYMAAMAVLWPTNDKDTQKPVAATPATPAAVAQAEAEARNRPPEWLTEARTYPALKQGADILHDFLPSKDLELTTKQFLEEKGSVQRKVDDKTLEMLSTPSASAAKPDLGPGYDDKSRLDLNSKVKP